MSIAAISPGPVPTADRLLLSQREAWEFLGISRSCWFKLKGANKLPKAVSLPDTFPRYRRADLERFAARLK
jgi:predicted DNA-binding transcriptional regulator AlpA